MTTTEIVAPPPATQTVQQPQQPQRHGRFVSLQVKLLIGFTVLFTVVFAAVFYWFYSLATTEAMNSIQQSLTDTVNGAIEGINGDEFASLVAQGQPNASGLSDDPRYWTELEWFKRVHDLDPRAYPYSYVPGPDVAGAKTNLFIVDSLQFADPSRAAGFKSSWTLNSGDSLGGFQQLTLKMTPYTDQWGSWVSAYAPIKDSSGQVVGALGVDYRADYVYQVQHDVLYEVLPVFVLVYVFLLLMVFVLSRTLTRSIRALTQAARRIGEGNYNQDLSRLYRQGLRDEISSLTDVIQMMMEKVRSREETLVRKVEQLTVQIDEARREKEVQAIVDSEFFQDLQTKARSMRARRSGQVADPPTP